MTGSTERDRAPWRAANSWMGQHALVVGREAAGLPDIREALQELGLRSTLALSISGAIVEASRACPHLLVLVGDFAIRDGLWLARALRSERSPAVIFVSDHMENTDLELASTIGATLLRRPSTKQQLVVALRAALDWQLASRLGT